MDDRGSREAFTRMGTLGIEEEYYVVDEHGRPTSGTDELVYESDPPEVIAGRLDHELFKCVIETQTPKIERLGDARESLLAVSSPDGGSSMSRKRTRPKVIAEL